MGSGSVCCSHVHCCLILVMLMVACLNDSFGVKAVKVERTQLNESSKNKATIINNIPNDIIHDNITIIKSSNLSEHSHTSLHPHSQNDKPSKFDFDTSETIYTDMQNFTKTQLNSSTNEKISCNNGILNECLDNNLDISHNKMQKKNTTESDRINKRDDKIVEKRNKNLFEEIHKFAKSHTLEINFNNSLFDPTDSRTFFGSMIDGNNTFLTGFGLGFLAFGLKKLLLPLFIGAQIIKSILVALFLPSIIGSIGKIVGKGVSSFAQSSQGATPSPDENFEFKDNSDLYNEDYMTRQPLGTLPASALYDEGMMMQPSQKPDSRYSNIDSRLSHINALNDRYYTRHVVNPVVKKQDFKVFHDIPTSSLLLTNYDPFYSPLLSRLDAVFSRLGHNDEGCREYAVCAMYRSPARYAPYSNLVSAQLSRELNELRRPAIDNTDILRFFRYMKAAKDGQDGIDCEDSYPHCNIGRDDPSLRQNQAMLATYQDIDKLVHARKL
ncbi:hypothetical protein PV325_008347 [Microctonus aethiopoides]|nr:hypothetical protein PV325_008347 [Microctonus aethiopoides]